jgi:hypothetical protein
MLPLSQTEVTIIGFVQGFLLSLILKTSISIKSFLLCYTYNNEPYLIRYI